VATSQKRAKKILSLIIYLNFSELIDFQSAELAFWSCPRYVEQKAPPSLTELTKES
jgi:hypothetical protein